MRMHQAAFAKWIWGIGAVLIAGRMFAGAEIDLVDGERVAFLGGTLWERERLYGEVETALTAHFAGRDITFRNLGWDGDTVYGHARAGGRRGAVFGDVDEGFGNLKQHVNRVDPTVVFLAYGNVEAHDGDEAVGEFEKGLNHLIETLSAPKRRFILFTPLRVLGEGIPSRSRAAAQVDRLNLQLRNYRDAILRVAARRAIQHIDLFSTDSLLKAGLRINGLHLNQAGCAKLGEQLVQFECVRGTAKAPIPSERYQSIRSFVQRKNELFYNWWRPRNDAFVFGERKREQVPVQQELPQFPSHIEDTEAFIRKLAY